MPDSRHVYMISDSTGETVRSIARACAVQFETIDIAEHLWPMVRSKRALETVLEDVGARPGIVLYTLLNHDLAQQLEEFCQSRRIPCISVLEPFMTVMARHFGAEIKGLPGRQHALDGEYFRRIEAINFVMTHDDGQMHDNIQQAEVVLVGVSRTSKTPTCIYLANRGVKAANVPFVPGIEPPPALLAASGPLVVGLTADPARLVEIRRNRVRIHNEGRESNYTDIEKIREEIAAARRLCQARGWPVIDVTRRSVEETAAAILQMLEQRRRDLETGTAPVQAP